MPWMGQSVVRSRLVSTEASTLETIARKHAGTPGGLLPALHAVQDELGHVPEAAVPVLARAFNRSRAEVHGVLTYYHHFRRETPGRHVLQLCRAEACQAMGADQLAAHLQQRLGCAWEQRRCDAAVSLESVYCLGLCASSPAMLVDGQPRARLTKQRVDQLVSELGLVEPGR